MSEPEPAAQQKPVEKTKPKRLVRILLAYVVLGAAVVVGMCVVMRDFWPLGFFSDFRPPPSDTSLRTLYQAHQSEFAKLRDMILVEPELLSIGDDNVGKFWLIGRTWRTDGTGTYTETEMLSRAGLSRERYRTYLKLLQAVGGFRVSRDSGSGQVTVCIARAGVVPAGYVKSIVFSPALPTPIVGDTEAHARTTSEGICYTTIGGNWYIEYDWR